MLDEIVNNDIGSDGGTAMGNGIGNLSLLTYLYLEIQNIQVEDDVLDEIVNVK